jgi:hypothetical protein
MKILLFQFLLSELIRGFSVFFRETSNLLLFLSDHIQKTLLDFLLFGLEFLLSSSQPKLEVYFSETKVALLLQFPL